MFDDNHSDSWISYYVYDCELGKKPKKVNLKNRSVTLRTVANLWDVLKEENFTPKKLSPSERARKAANARWDEEM